MARACTCDTPCGTEVPRKVAPLRRAAEQAVEQYGGCHHCPPANAGRPEAHERGPHSPRPFRRRPARAIAAAHPGSRRWYVFDIFQRPSHKRQRPIRSQLTTARCRTVLFLQFNSFNFNNLQKLLLQQISLATHLATHQPYNGFRHIYQPTME